MRFFASTLLLIGKIIFSSDVLTVSACNSKDDSPSPPPAKPTEILTTTLAYNFPHVGAGDYELPASDNHPIVVDYAKIPEKDNGKGDFEVLSNTAGGASEALRQDAVNNAILAWAFHGQKTNSEQLIADYIRTQFNQKYGPGWAVVISPRNSNHSTSTNFADSDFIALRRRSTNAALLHIFRPVCGLFKPPPPVSMDELNLADIQILDKSDKAMEPSIKQDAVSFFMLGSTLQTARMDIAKYIKDQMEKKYSGLWLAIVGDGEFSGSFSPTNNNMIFMRRGSFYAAVVLPDCPSAGGKSMPIPTPQNPQPQTAPPTQAATTTTTQPAPSYNTNNNNNNNVQSRSSIQFTVHSASKARPDMRDKCLTSTQRALQVANTTYDRCNFIKIDMEKQYGGRWFAGAGKTWSARYAMQDSNQIVMVSTGSAYTSYIQVYQQMCSPVKSIKPITTNARIVSYGMFQLMPDSDPKVLPIVTQDTMNWATSAIGRNSDAGTLCQSMRTEYEKKYGGYWTVAAGDISAVAVNYNSPNYIRLQTNATFNVLAFMHSKC